jgi:hypothetical protein
VATSGVSTVEELCDASGFTRSVEEKKWFSGLTDSPHSSIVFSTPLKNGRSREHCTCFGPICRAIFRLIVEQVEFTIDSAFNLYHITRGG